MIFMNNSCDYLDLREKFVIVALFFTKICFNNFLLTNNSINRGNIFLQDKKTSHSCLFFSSCAGFTSLEMTLTGSVIGK